MHQEGHWGVSLIIYSPLGATLLIFNRVDLAVLGCILFLGISMLPDYDQKIPFIKHRGITHTLWFALGIAAVTAFISSTLGFGLIYGFSVGFISITAHLVGDWLTPSGIRPFSPVFDKRYSLNIVNAGSDIANYGLLVVGIVFLAGVGWLAEWIRPYVTGLAGLL